MIDGSIDAVRRVPVPASLIYLLLGAGFLAVEAAAKAADGTLTDVALIAGACFSALDHVLTAPSATPCSNWRWSTRYRMNTGIAAISTAAATSSCGVLYW